MKIRCKCLHTFGISKLANMRSDEIDLACKAQKQELGGLASVPGSDSDLLGDNEEIISLP